MNKKIIVGIIGASMVLTLAACGGKAGSAQPPIPSPSVSQPANTSPVPTETPSAGIQVDESLLSVDITLPASIFEGQDLSAFDADAYAREEGFQKAVVNDDGSITVTMSQAKHKELLGDMTAQLEQSFSEMAGSEDFPYIREITYTENFGTITAKVDRTEYEAVTINFTQFSLGMSGMVYQAFTGNEVRVEVIIQDADTGDTIASSTYPDNMGG